MVQRWRQRPKEAQPSRTKAGDILGQAAIPSEIAAQWPQEELGCGICRRASPHKSAAEHSSRSRSIAS